jgi:hypothetical protein
MQQKALGQINKSSEVTCKDRADRAISLSCMLRLQVWDRADRVVSLLHMLRLWVWDRADSDQSVASIEALATLGYK